MGGGRGGMPRQGPPPVYAAGTAIDPYHTAPRAGANSGTGMDGDLNPAQRAVMQHQDEFIAGPVGTIGQAIEMDERTGSRSPPGAPGSAGHEHYTLPAGEHGAHYGLRDSDRDVAGMVGLQQGHPRMVRQESERSDVRSLGSVYSDKYVVLDNDHALAQYG